MSFSPLTKVGVAVAAVPTALAGGSIGMVSSNTPSKEQVERTHQKMNDLEATLDSQLSSLITDLVNVSVGKLKGDLSNLKQQIEETKSKFNSQLQGDTNNLNSTLSALEQQLINSIAQGDSSLESQLKNISSQVTSAKSQLESKLIEDTQTLKSNLSNSLSILSDLVKTKVASSQSTYQRLLERLKNRLSGLEKELTPVYVHSCQIELKKFRKDENSRTTDNLSSYSGTKNWSKIEDFLKEVKKENIKRPINYGGRIPTAWELEKDIKAKCHAQGGTGTINVKKVFTFYELDK